MQAATLIIGIVIGFGLAFVLLFVNAQRLMFHENPSKYDFEETIEKFNASVVSNEWKLLGEHDLQQKMKANGYDVLEAKVFDVCKPAYASQILMKDPERIVTPLMPCRVAIFKRTDGVTYISRMNSGLMSKPMKGIVPSVMKSAASDVEVIIEPLLQSKE